jgi:ornithine decarboxylase
MLKCYPDRIIQNVSLWNKFLPSVTPYYALKCNPHPKIISELSKLNINFECAAISEIKKCLPSKKDIIYGHPHKSPMEIKKAKNWNIHKIVYDSLTQLKLIHKIYPNSLPILRIQSCEELSKIKFNQKFGASDEELDEIIYFHKKNNFNLHGISFHVGSKCYYPVQYINTMDKIHALINKYNIKINLIDIGGGFPSIDNNFNETKFIEHVQSIEEYVQKFKKYKFVGEPGRFIVDNALTLDVKVINKKIKNINNNKVNIYYINDGVYGSMNGVVFDDRQIEDTHKNTYDTILYGQTCDSFDKIKCKLREYDIGETISFDNFGAYTWSAASSFNGFQRAKWKIIN